MMALWTNNRFRATPHRVVRIAPGSRYSVPFFFHPNPDVLIETLPTCRECGGAAAACADHQRRLSAPTPDRSLPLTISGGAMAEAADWFSASRSPCRIGSTAISSGCPRMCVLFSTRYAGRWPRPSAPLQRCWAACPRRWSWLALFLVTWQAGGLARGMFVAFALTLVGVTRHLGRSGPDVRAHPDLGAALPCGRACRSASPPPAPTASTRR